jgi:hypothetical protein
MLTALAERALDATSKAAAAAAAADKENSAQPASRQRGRCWCAGAVSRQRASTDSAS